MENQIKSSDYIGSSSEIDLISYIRLLLKRKKIILIFCLILGFSAGIFSLLQKNNYEGEMIIKIGTIGEAPISSIDQLAVEINNGIYKDKISEDLKLSPSNIFEIKATPITSTNLIKLEIKSLDFNIIAGVLEEIKKIIFEEQNIKIQEKKQTLQENITALKENKSILTEKEIIINNKIKIAEQDKTNLEIKESFLKQIYSYQQINPVTAGSIFPLFDVQEKLGIKKQEIENLNLEKNQLEIQLNSQKEQISSLEKGLSSISSPEVKKNVNVSKKYTLISRMIFNIVIAIFLGLFIGIIFVIMREWWEKSKLRLE